MQRAQLIDAATLARQLQDPDVLVVDVTTYLRRQVDGGPYAVEGGRTDYETAHIPGAVFVDIPGALSEPDSPFPFTLPSEVRFAQELGRIGVGTGTKVVVYARESPMWSTRLWWLLRYFGFDQVSVLDGGLRAWQAAGGSVTSQPSTSSPATFQSKPRPDLLASVDDVMRVLDGSPACLVNALAPAAFRGDGPGAYSRPGRIPRSLNVPSSQLIDQTTGGFRPLIELSQVLSHLVDLPSNVPIIAYCGGGISATVDIFALSLLGRNDVRLYDGSLTEWSSNPLLPLEIG
jgi:thiosulfate/3-mercaptopyruvate sulfurtransferase